MAKVFAVSSGSYSDYSIHAIFSTKEGAEQFISRFVTGYDPYEIEEYELDPAEKFVKKGLIPYRVFIDRDGAAECTQMDSMYDIPSGTEEEFLAKTYHGRPVLRVTGWFKSSDHAVKVANERRTQRIAQNLWELTESSPVAQTFAGEQMRGGW